MKTRTATTTSARREGGQPRDAGQPGPGLDGRVRLVALRLLPRRAVVVRRGLGSRRAHGRTAARRGRRRVVARRRAIDRASRRRAARRGFGDEAGQLIRGRRGWVRPHRLAAGKPVGGAAGQPRPGGRGRATGQELRSRGIAFGGRPAIRPGPRAAAGPRRRRGPVTRRIAPDQGFGVGSRLRPLVGVSVVVDLRGVDVRRVVLARVVELEPEVVLLGADLGRWPRGRLRGDARRGRGCPARAADARAAGLRGFAPRPVLERRADREGARQAVRLLVGEGARRGLRLRVAAVPMIGRGRTLVAFVLEGDERAGRRPVDAGQPSVGHRGDDTRRCGG